MFASVVLALTACGLAAAYGFWTGPSHRLLKLEAALGIAVVGLAVLPVAFAQPRSRDPRASVEPRFTLAFAAAQLSAAAAIVHVAVIEQHLSDWWLYGVFFALLGPAQMAWSIAVAIRPARGLYLIGAAGNALVIAFFVVTRTIGPLIGPEAGMAERVGFGDTATTVFEALVVILCLVLLTRASDRWRLTRLSLPGAASLVTLLLVPQLALALQSATASAPFVPHSG